MHGMHIAGIDLNLAVVLHVLLEERNVSRAGKRLALSQSATSHALSRLRDLLADPLFVRTPRGLTPTARAEALAPQLAQGLLAIEGSLFSPPVFDPATARKDFTIGSSDYGDLLAMPGLLTRLAKLGPNMNVWSRTAPADARVHVASGELDLLVCPPDGHEGLDQLHGEELWRDEFVVVMRRGHPLTKQKLTLARYADAEHAFVAPRGRHGGIVDKVLAEHGRHRRIAFSTPNFLVAPQVVAKTDLVITLAARIARGFAKRLPLVLMPPPVKLPGFSIHMYWHDRTDTDPAHRFLREQLTQVAHAL